MQLKLNPQQLKRSISHQFWLRLQGEPSFVELAGKSVALLVSTVQGAKRIELQPDISSHGAACGNKESAGQVRQVPAKPRTSGATDPIRASPVR
jgi:hypothetical protein